MATTLSLRYTRDMAIINTSTQLRGPRFSPVCVHYAVASMHRCTVRACMRACVCPFRTCARAESASRGPCTVSCCILSRAMVNVVLLPLSSLALPPLCCTRARTHTHTHTRMYPTWTRQPFLSLTLSVPPSSPFLFNSVLDAPKCGSSSDQPVHPSRCLCPPATSASTAARAPAAAAIVSSASYLSARLMILSFVNEASHWPLSFFTPCVFQPLDARREFSLSKLRYFLQFQIYLSVTQAKRIIYYFSIISIQ